MAKGAGRGIDSRPSPGTRRRRSSRFCARSDELDGGGLAEKIHLARAHVVDAAGDEDVARLLQTVQDEALLAQLAHRVMHVFPGRSVHERLVLAVLAPG